MGGKASLKVILTVDQVRQPLTGVGRYAFELSREMKSVPGVDSVRLLSGSHFAEKIVSDSSAPNKLQSVSNLLAKSSFAVSVYSALSSGLKARRLRGFEDHILHGTSFYLPPFRGRSVVTIHDLSPFRWPEFHPPERVRYMARAIRQSLGQASLLITDSEFTRREAAAWFDWPLEKIRAVPLASHTEFRPRPLEELSAPLAKLGLLAGEYCLFVGTIEPRKNLATLLQAYEKLPAVVRRRWPLVLTGFKGWGSGEVHARIAKAAAEGWAKYLGYVTAEDLPLVYSGARLFVFPSRYEGFGLPVLEAMASGVPVVCSNASSLPEVVGEAGAVCDPMDVETLSKLIGIGLEDPVWRCAARFRGLARSARFTWRRCAEETHAAYSAVVQG